MTDLNFSPAADRERARVMVCFGTRPEVIKLAPVIAELRRVDLFDVQVVTTAQHREMLDQMLEVFGIVPDVDLQLMRPNQNLAELTARAITSVSSVIEEHRPDAVLVQGDTTTVFSAALAAFYEHIPVGHVEAGLRTDDPYRPFPEEINRRLATQVARWHFCATQLNADRLIAEGVSPAGVYVTGNTVIDALLSVASRPVDAPAALPPRRAKHRLVVTLHRRETQGDQQRDLCRMLARVARSEDVEIVFPVHLSPAVRASVMPELTGLDNVHLVEPVDYVSFVHLMKSATVIVTDSGGVQEEAPALDVPVLVMRETTERPEGVDAGCARLCGVDHEQVEADILELLRDPGARTRMGAAPNPYGDGHAAPRIVEALARDLLGSRSRLEPVA